jgi:signal transduction histidine kinase
VGIAPDLKDQLFAPFKQAQRMTGGTGLGLYSMKKRIEALGGACGVRDRRDGQQG